MTGTHRIFDLIDEFLDEEDKIPKNMERKKESFVNKELIGTDLSYTHQIVWGNVFLFLILHSCGLYGLYLFLRGTFSVATLCWTLAIILILNQGITVGAHRYYTHKTFKAKPILQYLFILAQTLAGQNAMFTWVRDHRLHHRYSDTDGDPHNSKRGFFFCHIGWLMCRKNPLVIELGKKIDMADLLADPLVMWQKKYYYQLYFVVTFFIPIAIPAYYFGETWTNSMMFCYFARYMIILNFTWFVNSIAHLYGTRPYDKKLQPVESWFVSLVTGGEGWHNYHHAFPWDYKAAEEGMPLNLSTTVIRFFERIGWAYDLKSADPQMLQRRIIQSGDGSHRVLRDDKTAVTAFGPVHPLNPSYRTKHEAPDALLHIKGLPLDLEDLLSESESKDAKVGFVDKERMAKSG